MAADTESQQDPLKNALQYWRDIDLKGKLRLVLDQQGLDVVQNQQDTIATKKQLADDTRAFKQLPEDRKLAQLKPLLRSYQGEIDKLIGRLKIAEEAFLNVYAILNDAPDPATLLSTALECIEAAKLVETLSMEKEQLKADLAKSQSDNSILKQSETRLKRDIETLEEKLNTLASSSDSYTMPVSMAAASESDVEALKTQLQRERDRVNMLQAKLEAAQLPWMEKVRNLEERLSAKMSELDLVAVEFEQSRNECAQLRQANQNQQSKPVVNNQLYDELSKCRTRLDELERSHVKLESDYGRVQQEKLQLNERVIQLQQETDDQEKEIARLNETVIKQADYETIRGELESIKSVEFGPNSSQNQSLNINQLLQQKNKRLENDLTEARHRLQTALEEKEKAENEKVRLTDDLKEQLQLNQKLETDLLHLQQRPGTRPRSKSEQTIERSSVKSADILRDITANIVPDSSEHIVPTTSQPVASAEQNQSLLPIVTAQRDRFQQRNQELEDAKRTLDQKLLDVKAEVESLKQDNIKLYEKIRYLQNYRPVSQPTSQENLQQGTMDRYSDLYEQKLNPFLAFHKKEAARHAASMSPADKISLALSRLLVSNKYSRWLVLCYFIFLHLLVFVVVLRMSRVAECRHDHDVKFWRDHLDAISATHRVGRFGGSKPASLGLTEDELRKELTMVKEILEKQLETKT